ncbi:hypothetical protein QYF68_00830 [Mycolicibacterium austroafricanum]|uniref:Uncharacterized protein n=1 Tax=Mycolicibacterium austroafricanum TaxID=39687 RepID=A0ABT8H6H8_MYCAO|nr:hypothetical protein [Mycolicibacterium austroafricanum]MDN4516372.1 hypothetical protein [Mycolicibacterium austroafricanum]
MVGRFRWFLLRERARRRPRPRRVDRLLPGVAVWHRFLLAAVVGVV